MLVLLTSGIAYAETQTAVPTQQDYDMIHLVYEDLAEYLKKEDQVETIYFRNRTYRALSENIISQVKSDLRGEKDKVIPDNVMRSLIDRNKSIVTLTELKSSNQSLNVYSDDKELPIKDGIMLMPGGSTRLHMYLPGYSDDQSVAVVRLEFTWSMHSASGTYLLKKTENIWKIIWRKFSYYV